MTPDPALAPHFEPALPEKLRLHVQAQLARVKEPLPAPLSFSTAERRSPHASGPTVSFFDGQLGPAHAAMLERDGELALCALRDGGLPAEWELELLLSVLAGRSIPGHLASWRQQTVDSVAAITHAAAHANDAAQECGGSASFAKLASDVTHELVTNALLAAPADVDGSPRYAKRRDSSPEIAQEDACSFAVGLSKDRLFLCTTDRFGRLTPEPLARTLRSYGAKVQPNTTGGGAGLGMRLMIEHCDLLLFRVSPGRSTEVLGVISVEGPRRRAGLPKSLFFLRTAAEVRGGVRVR